VYDNNGTAIICSLNCYNIRFEKNIVYNNHGGGIVFSRNTTHSVARNNYVHDQTIPIQIAASYNNAVYNNTISNTNTTGISIIGDSSGNKIFNNTIMNAQSAFGIKNTAANNMIYANKLIDVKSLGTAGRSSSSSSSGGGGGATAEAP
ncbi:MAG: right-handed parallel beta-helix repeat-containing protein, partial [Nitrososphaeraceae archaeon]